MQQYEDWANSIIYRWKSRARVWKLAAKKYRKKYLDEIAAQKWVLDQLLEALKHKDEARRLAIHFKQKADERGEWMGNRLLSAASENRRRRELEKRISVLEAACREALDAAEYCTEPPFEELREALGIEEERWTRKDLTR